MDRFEVFDQGIELLSPMLRLHGFEFGGRHVHQYASIIGRREEAVRGEFARGDHRLELELWHSLRNVIYRIDDLRLAHEPYMRALGVPPAANAYPGFSNDPLDGFRHLKTDLESYGREFLAGDAEAFRRAAAEEVERQPDRQRAYMAWMVGDDSARRLARELFHARKFVDVVAVLDALKYPEFMDTYERKILEVSRRKADAR
jgi:hypothetical protein